MDASCGPSNGVKQLQRHFDQDRSLHQSQVRSGSAASQFRNPHSQAQLSRASQDQEAFLRGGRAGPAQLESHQQPQDHQNWAQDFQRSAHHAQLQPAPRQGQFQNSIQGPPQVNGWGADFLAFQKSHNTPLQSSSTPHDPQLQQFNRPQFQQPQIQPYLFMPTPAAQIHSQSLEPLQSSSTTQATSTDQSSLFTQAFADAEASLTSMNLSPDASLLNTSLPPHSASDLRDLDTRESLDALDSRLEKDELSSTAGELIHHLRSEQSDKFKNSSFMRLMHQLRDGDVVVDDDRKKMVKKETGDAIGSHLGPTDQ